MLYTVSIVLTEVVAAILLFYLSPVWATLLGRVLLAETLTPLSSCRTGAGTRRAVGGARQRERGAAAAQFR